MQVESIKELTSKARGNLDKAAKYREKADALQGDNAHDAEIYRSFAHTLEQDAEELAHIALKLSR